MIKIRWKRSILGCEPNDLCLCNWIVQQSVTKSQKQTKSNRPRGGIGKEWKIIFFDLSFNKDLSVWCLRALTTFLPNCNESLLHRAPTTTLSSREASQAPEDWNFLLTLLRCFFSALSSVLLRDWWNVTIDEEKNCFLGFFLWSFFLLRGMATWE